MLTGYWLNDVVRQVLGVACAALMRAAGVDTGLPNSNEDFVMY